MSEKKKIYFVCAPIFLYWPVEITKMINQKYDIISGGFIGGPRKYHQILQDEWGSLADQVIYTHDLEVTWLKNSYKDDDMEFFIDLLGNKILNELVIADRHVGNGLLAGGGISNSKFLQDILSDKKSHLNYIINMLRYLYDFLNKNKPDLFYSYAVAGAMTLAIAELCAKLEIPFFKLTHSRMSNIIVIDSDPRDGMVLVEQKFKQDINTYNTENIIWAKKYLEEFRKKQEQPDYQKSQNNVYLQKTKFKYKIKLFGKYLKGQFDKSNDFTHNSYLDNVDYDVKTVSGIRKFWKEMPFYNGNNFINDNFLFYTLHVDPEASTMVNSAMQTNQLAVLEAISKSKPFNYILLVKEHLTMIGRRPADFYKKINNFPGVYLIDPREPSFKYINKAKAVVTLTGTSGFEAILLRKPAIFLGNFLYKFIEQGFVLTNDLSSLPLILNNVDQIECADDETLIKLIAAVKEVGFPFDGNLIWSGVDKDKVLSNMEEVKKISDKFIELLE